MSITELIFEQILRALVTAKFKFDWAQSVLFNDNLESFIHDFISNP